LRMISSACVGSVMQPTAAAALLFPVPDRVNRCCWTTLRGRKTMICNDIGAICKSLDRLPRSRLRTLVFELSDSTGLDENNAGESKPGEEARDKALSGAGDPKAIRR